MKILDFAPGKRKVKKIGVEFNFLGICKIKIPQLNNIIFVGCSVLEFQGFIFFEFPNIPYTENGEDKSFETVVVEDEHFYISLQSDFMKAWEEFNEKNKTKD